MNSNSLNMLAVGDIILGPDAEAFFTYVKPVLDAGDVLVGQLEVPYTKRDPEAVSLGRDPDNLQALVSAGFDVVTLAGNHIWDAGVQGIEDTMAWLKKHGIAFTGAGMNIEEARLPVIIDCEGTRFGFLNYNCVGPKEMWASRDKAGCAYVHIITHYELEYATPGGPPAIYTWAEPDSLGQMVEDISRLRPLCDILVVSLHKGLVHMPVKLAAYEHQVSYAAIDAGADLVVGQHAHILKGIELYKGKAIFHGLCNLVAFLPSLVPKPGQDPKSWAARRREIFGFEPDPEYPTYPFHPEAKYTIIAKCKIKDKKISQVSYIPCLVNKQGQPEVMKRDARGEKVFEYMEKITRDAGLNAEFDWQEDEIVVKGS
ncbi:MAG: CapA family protein [Bacillota bacterium]|nr:CapA family protein [Bacillota bacterium]